MDHFSNHLIELYENKKYADIYPFWIKNSPQFVYRFMKLGQDYDEQVLQNLKNNKLYFSYVFEFWEAENGDKNEWRNVLYDVQTLDSKKMATELSKRRYKKNLICCFTDINLSEEAQKKMWKERANNKNGFRCKYKVNRPEEMIRICYSNKKFYMTELGKNEEEDVERNNYLLDLLFYLKEEKYSWEREYRMIYDFEDTPSIIARLNIPAHHYVLTV